VRSRRRRLRAKNAWSVSTPHREKRLRVLTQGTGRAQKQQQCITPSAPRPARGTLLLGLRAAPAEPARPIARMAGGDAEDDSVFAACRTTSLSQFLATYGLTAIVVYGVISLGTFCAVFALISWGVDVTPLLRSLGFSKGESGATIFVTSVRRPSVHLARLVLALFVLPRGRRRKNQQKRCSYAADIRSTAAGTDHETPRAVAERHRGWSSRGRPRSNAAKMMGNGLRSEAQVPVKLPIAAFLTVHITRERARRHQDDVELHRLLDSPEDEEDVRSRLFDETGDDALSDEDETLKRPDSPGSPQPALVKV